MSNLDLLPENMRRIRSLAISLKDEIEALSTEDRATLGALEFTKRRRKSLQYALYTFVGAINRSATALAAALAAK
jgi:hypothetical protein